MANPNYSSDSQLLDFNASANAHGRRATPVTKEIREQLCQVYLLRVDPVFKVLHGPSLRDHLLERKKYLNYDPGHPAVEALVSSVYYAATGSLSETQCLSLFAASQAAVITRYQAECEAALGRAGLVATEDLTVLQAFIIFLVSLILHTFIGVYPCPNCRYLYLMQVTLRSRDQSRRMWTLLSLAVRIAQALSLHIENPPFTMQPFEHEIRRRVWFAIGLLDVQASLDRASQPMIPAAWLQTQLPANINDSDLWFGFEGCLQDSVEFTDMTFTSMTCTAQCIARMLIFPPAAETGATSWNIRQCYVDTFRERAAILLQRCEPRKVPFHWYARQVATYISASLQLLALRPLRRLPKSSAPRVRPHSLLKLAVEVLEQAQHLIKDHRGHAWYWFDSIFVEWHALAVATTEVYICEDKELMEKCWPTIELAFNHFSFLVADSKKGMIWTPVENLMDKARGKLQMVCFNHRAAKEQSADLNTALLEPSTSADVQPHPRSQTSNDTQGADLLMRSVDNLDFAPVLDNTIACQDAWEGVDLTDHGLNPFSDMAWADWESLVDDLNIGDEAVNIFPFHGYSA